MAKGPSPMTIKARNPGKKYDKAILECSTPGCHNGFLISYKPQDGDVHLHQTRKCAPCVFNPPQVSERKTLETTLRRLALIT